uniref:PhzB n=1 Tax=Pseudomonas chlororaphis TaxID=333 RepID=Q9R9G6_PSECL|nr:PhzB [Pseudomonas chlororaphis]
MPNSAAQQLTASDNGTSPQEPRHGRAIYAYQRPGPPRRHELFTEDGTGGLWTTDTGAPIVISGKAKLAEHAVWSLKCFPDWEWYNVKVFETDDPNHFWVECDGHGKILFPGYPEGYYENHFLHSFELEDGKVKRNREFMNVFQQLRALGIPVPQIKREGIPT